jgi:3-hydroxyisobutyrate dehydrogenase-like beta-hydroxyacid dehydrogenase
VSRPIGFIGVGTMGKLMAGHLLRAHYPVTVPITISSPASWLI